MKIFYCIFLLLVIFFNTQASPGTYYNSIDTNQSCSSFKSALTSLISLDVHLPYGQIDNNYNKTDLKPAEAPFTGFVVMDRYCSEIPSGLDSCNFRFDDNTPGVRSFCFSGGSGNLCACYAKEHTFPKSWFGGEIEPMYSDMHFIWPADGKTNNEKSNFPLGYVRPSASFTSYNGTKIGRSDASLNFGYTGAKSDTFSAGVNKQYNYVFEPIDAFKGDFARAYLYVATRYGASISSWKNLDTIGSKVISANSYTGLEPWILQLCVKWHKQDPPSAFEQKRNDSVQTIQGNRNPYIDFPNWVEKIFGEDGISASCVNTPVLNHKTTSFNIYPNPVKDGFIHLDFNETILENARVEILDVLGRTQLTQEIKPTNSGITIDVKNLTNGIYLLNVIYKNANNTIRFVKE
ncbi:MAG TPA: endonuclease [Chitinophagales bacterium]|jgi:endonuclease I|nr:endonuclease [Chitinophagales bacterium]HQW79610.1 endonuclease [Chitinophagales bacterium]HRB66953.1 endonuclease [Chitinophagales bacterium]HRB92228.1 endonuclease [Chitinophagales bacterium]